MIHAVNNTNFQGKFCRYSSHTPKARPYREFEFMPKLQKPNPIKKFFSRLIEEYKGIRDAMKPDNEIDSAAGMTFEA